VAIAWKRRDPDDVGFREVRVVGAGAQPRRVGPARRVGGSKRGAIDGLYTGVLLDFERSVVA